MKLTDLKIKRIKPSEKPFKVRASTAADHEVSSKVWSPVRFMKSATITLRTAGTSKGRFFYGPGSDNYDMALAKKLDFTESRAVIFRVDAFNIFNHTQFSGPSSVDGDIGSSTFGQAISASPARVLQGAIKLI
jgi:hypothetical protein